MDICVLAFWKEKWKHVERPTQDPPATRWQLNLQLFIDLLRPQEEWLCCCHVALLQTLPVGLDFGYLRHAQEQPLVAEDSSHLSYAQVSLIRILEKSNQMQFLLP